MSDRLAEDIGQLLVVGFGDATEKAPDSIRQALGSGEIGGVILFRRNVGTIDQLLSLTTDIHDAAKDAPITPFVAVDQEGGRVVRVGEPLTPLPPMRNLGKAANLRDVATVSEMLASEIGALGFNLNFAPVLDVDTNPDNPVIGDRAFSDDPERVARCGAGVLVGHHTAGVVPCGKHFPGHGDTIVDSHLDLPKLMHDEERLERIEFYPFERAIAAGIPMIMTAHIQLPVLDAFHPATFSPAILDGLLRKRLQFDGVIITDCLEMKAVADRYEIEEMVDLGVEAGVDIFLICHTEDKWRRAFKHLYDRATSDDKFRTRIEASAARVRKLKTDLLGHWPRPWTPREGLDEFLGCEEHRAMVQPYLDDTSIADDPTES